MAFPQQIQSPPQDQAEVLVNENFSAVGHQAVYGMSPLTTTALTWGYYGGRWGGFSVADGTLTLTNSATNYIVVAIATGVISVSTSNTNWNNATDYVRVYQLTTAGGVVTATQDHRGGPGGVHGGAGGAGGLSTFSDSLSTTSPNGTNDAASTLTPITAGTNSDFVAQPKAAGANLAQTPDATTTGGNKRGARATDWQKTRASADQVASGTTSTIGGGSNNKASGTDSTVPGGNSCTASGDNAHATGTNAVASGTTSSAIGSDVVADANVSHARGRQAWTRGIVGADAWASGQRSTRGDHQKLELALRVSTSDATPAVMTSDGQAAFAFFPNELLIETAGCMTVRGLVSAHKTTNDDCKSWSFDASLKRTSGGTVSLVASVTPVVIAGDAGASGWSIAVTADNTNKCLQVEVTGQAASAINWTCALVSCEVTN